MHIDYAAAVAGAEALRDEFGAETIYRELYERETGERSPACSNTQENLDGSISGSCIVGRFVISTLNIEPLEIHHGRDGWGASLKHAGANRLIAWVQTQGHTVTEKAADFLGELQTKQDNGMPWGSAIEAARRGIDSGERDGFLQYNEDESRNRM